MSGEDFGYPDLLPGELDAIEAEDRRKEQAEAIRARVASSAAPGDPGTAAPRR